MKSKRIIELESKLESYGNIAIAFSGGVDSTLLAKAAYEALGDKSIAITIHSNMHAGYEMQEAKELAEEIGIKHVVLAVDAFEIPNFAENGDLRCYHCKTGIFTTIKNIAKDNGITNIADGSNLDDLSDYRPGMKALEELNIVSPLKDLDMTKDEIRILSKEYGLHTWTKAAFACLATRVPTGEIITEAKLRMVEKAETYLVERGFVQYRVRCHGDMARIEVAPEERQKFYDDDFMDKVSEAFKEFGFRYVSLDLGGYKKGNMNKE